jgi:hypothetical protein
MRGKTNEMKVFPGLFEEAMRHTGIVIFFLFVLALPAFAADVPVWVEATGEAAMGEVDTPKEVKERAKRDAQSKAVEKAVGVFLKAHTLVSNYQVADDLIYASVRGVADKVDVLHEGWDEKDRNLYRVSMKALVKPVYPERGEGLSLKASLSKTDLKEGEEVNIFYQTNADAYIYLFSVAADGSVTLLFPNKLYQDNFIHSGKAYEFPPEACPIHLQAQFLPDFKKPVAEEKVKIIATKQKEEIISLGFREGMFKAYDARSTGMISELVRRLNQLDPASWTESTLVYRIIR